MSRYVIYKRVSTRDQGRSGLGLAAQDRDIQIYLQTAPDAPCDVIAEYTDIESGMKQDRPELEKALALARSQGAILLVSKLDRLSRKVSQIAALMEDKKLRFKVACMPMADNFQLHLYAALAEQERDFISKRTKAALQAAKARGTKLGGLKDKTNQRNKVQMAQADARAEELKKLVMPMRDNGATLKDIADALNAAHLKTPRGSNFCPKKVLRVLKRLAA